MHTIIAQATYLAEGLLVLGLATGASFLSIVGCMLSFTKRLAGQLVCAVTALFLGSTAMLLILGFNDWDIHAITFAVDVHPWLAVFYLPFVLGPAGICIFVGRSIHRSWARRGKK
jgi:hypothetical protein